MHLQMYKNIYIYVCVCNHIFIYVYNLYIQPHHLSTYLRMVAMFKIRLTWTGGIQDGLHPFIAIFHFETAVRDILWTADRSSLGFYLEVSWNRGTSKSSILNHFNRIFHLYTIHLGVPHVWTPPYVLISTLHHSNDSQRVQTVLFETLSIHLWDPRRDRDDWDDWSFLKMTSDGHGIVLDLRSYESGGPCLNSLMKQNNVCVYIWQKKTYVGTSSTTRSLHENLRQGQIGNHEPLNFNNKHGQFESPRKN